MYPPYTTNSDPTDISSVPPPSSSSTTTSANQDTSNYYSQFTSDPIYAAYLSQYYSAYNPTPQTGPVDLDSVIVKSQSTRKQQSIPKQPQLNHIHSDEPTTPTQKSTKRKAVPASNEPKKDNYSPIDTMKVPPPLPSDEEPLPKKKKLIRYAAGKVWEDKSLMEWPESPEVVTQTLESAFNKYPSFQKAYVVRDPKTLKSKGYGFVSFMNADDYTKAFREYDNKYLGSRPVKLRKSAWQDRNIEKKKDKLKRIFG